MKSIGHPILAGLTDICADILAYGARMRRAADPGEAFRSEIEELLSIMESRARQAGVSEADLQLAKYALVAYVDELVLAGDWAIKDSWASQPLQLEHFNDLAAGEEFFNKLDSLRRDAARVDVLEVYYLAIALGFKGRYGGLEGLEKLARLCSELETEIHHARSISTELSESWKPPDEFGPIVKNFPTWIVVVACLGVLLLVYVTLAAILSGTTGNVLERIG